MATFIDVKWPGPNEGRIRRWIYPNGSKVKKGEIIAHCEPSCEFTSPESGEIRFKVPNGTDVKPGDILATIVICKHEAHYHGICLTCNSNISYDMEINKDEYSKVVSHLDPGLGRKQSIVQEQFQANKEQLIREKRLWMLLDLDQTILHTTTIHYNPEWKRAECIKFEDEEDTFIFRTKESSRYYIVKFRPGLREFLVHASELYEIHVYTAGTYSYAHILVKIIQDHILKGLERSVINRIFGSRIITRDHTKNDRQKDILQVFPSKNMVIIIDDSPHVWYNYEDHVIKIQRYFFFKDAIDMNILHEKGHNESKDFTEPKSKRAKTKESEDEEDGDSDIGRLKDTHLYFSKSARNDKALELMSKLISKVHQRYYFEDENIQKDCGKILRNLRRNVLYGARLCFSSLIPTEENPTQSYVWKMATMYGARCASTIDKDNSAGLTHLVAKKDGTDKVNIALQLSELFLVNENWFWDSIDKWEWQDEEKYPLDGYDVYKDNKPDIPDKAALPWEEETDEELTDEELLEDEESLIEEDEEREKEEEEEGEKGEEGDDDLDAMIDEIFS